MTLQRTRNSNGHKLWIKKYENDKILMTRLLILVTVYKQQVLLLRIVYIVRVQVLF